MLIYNTQTSVNPFGFQNKKANQPNSFGIQSSAVGRATPKSGKCLKKRLTKKNIRFLKSLGFKVKK